MKAIILPEFGKKNLQLTTIPDPKKPGAGEVLIQYKAASLNYRDTLVIAGKYNPKFPRPIIPCSDGAGIVLEVGSDVTEFRPGDRVMSTFAPYWIDGNAENWELRTTLGAPLPGTLREYATLPASGLVHRPDYLSDIEAATLRCAAVTAWSSLVRLGGIKSGDWVVVQGTGGVSLFALQIAKMHGAKVILTTSDSAKQSKALKMGADEIINYKETPSWGKRVREITNKRGADHIIEVGGAGTLQESVKAVRSFGNIHLIGVLGGGQGEFEFLPVVMNQVRMQGVVVGPRNSFIEMNRAFAAHETRPVVDKVFSWNDFRESLDYLKSGSHFGKVVVRLD
ncbi:MAG: NAD(P)-dependent alcohol dehydrogenase [Leptospira sp.]|nr:NAD(P)-dependent alcohol dehydrogenase [Leptospira sp.]